MPGNSFVLKACDKTFLQVYDPNPEDPVTHTLSYMHTKTHTHTFSFFMGCMQDYTYCTESCWSYTTGAGIVLDSPTCDVKCGGRLSYPSLLPPYWSNTACGIFPVSSVSCAGVETPRWRCVIARYCMLK